MTFTRGRISGLLSSTGVRVTYDIIRVIGHGSVGLSHTLGVHLRPDVEVGKVDNRVSKAPTDTWRGDEVIKISLVE